MMNTTTAQHKNLGLTEFVSLMALLMSLAALSIDAMLPALPDMGQDLGVINPNHNQLVITMLFIGMSLGMTIYGPLSDSYGRKPLVYTGMICFIIGSIVSVITNQFEIMLFGRFLQGLGAASTRVVGMAMIRDLYSGNQMAKTMSLINMVFIIVPTLAPTIGAAILYFFHWKAIFVLFIILSLLSTLWLYLRQPETLQESEQRPFNFYHFKFATIRVFTQPQAIGYGVSSGLIFGAFLGYLLSSQQIFQDVFGLKEEFPYYFGGLALMIGFASFLNSRLVEKMGMAPLTKVATLGIIFSSASYAIYLYLTNHNTSIIVFMMFMIPTFMCVGILFGNMNSLALEPLGDIAGMGSSIISTINNLLSISLGAFIGSLFEGDLIPLVSGFLILSIATYIVILKIDFFLAKIDK